MPKLLNLRQNLVRALISASVPHTGVEQSAVPPPPPLVFRLPSYKANKNQTPMHFSPLPKTPK